MDDYPFNKGSEEAIDERSLIALIKDRPEVYDHSNRNFRRIDRRSQAWVDIADELSTTVAICKSRWKAIRHVLRRDFTTPKKKPYYLRDALEFYIPYLNLPKDEFQDESTQMVLEEDEENEQEDTAPSWQVMQPHQLPPLVPIQSRNKSTPSSISIKPSQKSSGVKRLRSSSPQTPSPLIRVRSHSEISSPAPQKRSQPETSHSSKQFAPSHQTSSTGDADQGFLFSLLTDLETLDPGKRRIFKEKVSIWLRELHEEMDNECERNQQVYVVDSNTSYDSDQQDKEGLSDHALHDHIY